jgi:hypothetical protein
MTTPEQPYGPGAVCDDCGHWAARHNSQGCDTTDLVARGIRKKPCDCPAFLWKGTRWSEPSRPDGIAS